MVKEEANPYKSTSECSVEEALEAHENLVEGEEPLLDESPLLFPLPVEESPSHAG